MARVFSSGFETGSVALASFAFGEFDGTYSLSGGSANPGSISTTTVRTGTSALRLNGNLAAGDTQGVFQDTHNGSSNKKLWGRAYVRFASFPSNNLSVLGLGDNFASSTITATINANGTAQIAWTSTGGTTTFVTPASSALNLNQWYRFEIFGDVTTGTAWAGEFRIDGTTIATFSNANGGSNTSMASIHFFVANSAGLATTGVDIFLDDCAANDASGSNNNSWCGDGSIVHMLPDAAGDSNQWLKQGGGAADSNNFQSVDEQNPDNTTTYLKRTATGTLTDDYNCQSSASAGIGGSDTIKLVQVGVRFGATSTTSTNRTGILRIKGQASGTVQSSSALAWNLNGWGNHSVFSTTGPVTAPYGLTAETNPQDGSAWTSATLDTMQIGFQNASSSTNEIRVSAIWALVEFIPINAPLATAVFAAQGGFSSSTILKADADIEADANFNFFTGTKLNAAIFSNLNSLGSFTANTIQRAAALSSLSGDTTLSCDTLIYLRLAAILPATASVSLDAIPKFVFGTTLAPTSGLSATPRQVWNTNTAVLAADSGVSANVTRQNFAALAFLTCSSDLSASLTEKFACTAKFDTISSLQALAWQGWRDTATLPIASDLNATAKQRWAGLATLLANSTLSISTIQKFAGFATIAPSSMMDATGAGKFQQLNPILAPDSGLSVNAICVRKAVASLPIASDLSAAADRYTKTTANIPVSVILSAGSDKYAIAVATLAANSNNFFSDTRFKAAIYANLGCSSSLLTATNQLVLWYATFLLAADSSLISTPKLKLPINSSWTFTSSLAVAFTPLLTPSFAISLSGDTTLSVSTSIKDRNVKSTLLATATFAANSLYILSLQPSLVPSFGLSLSAFQKWNSKANLNASIIVQAATLQKMFVTSKINNIQSKFFADTDQLMSSKITSGFQSSLRVNTVLHLVKNHNKTQKHLKGGFSIKHLKAGMAEEVVDDGVIP